MVFLKYPAIISGNYWKNGPNMIKAAIRIWEATITYLKVYFTKIQNLATGDAKMIAVQAKRGGRFLVDSDSPICKDLAECTGKVQAFADAKKAAVAAEAPLIAMFKPVENGLFFEVAEEVLGIRSAISHNTVLP